MVLGPRPRDQHWQTPTLGVRVLSAGLAGCIADSITFPLDLAKVRLQVQGEGLVMDGDFKSHIASQKYRGMFNTVLTVAREEGGRALYNGIIPGLQRQLCFCAVRIGLYDSFRNFYFSTFLGPDQADSGGHLPLRILAGITTGALSVLVAQPTDVVKVRMQAEHSGEPRRYKGSINAYQTIGKTEGIKGLWKGTMPNVTRNSIVNAAELVSYDLIKTKILSLGLLSDNMPCHFVSALGAGFFTTVVASPVDVVKTRYMNSPLAHYRGALHCAALMWKEAGVYAFYRGFMPSFIRLGAWNICMFVAFEQLKRGFMTVLHPLPSGVTPRREPRTLANS